MIDKKKIFDATMLTFPVEAHISVSSSFAIHYLSIQICMELIYSGTLYHNKYGVVVGYYYFRI